jgi:hypothetical protein
LLLKLQKSALFAGGRDCRTAADMESSGKLSPRTFQLEQPVDPMQSNAAKNPPRQASRHLHLNWLIVPNMANRT